MKVEDEEDGGEKERNEEKEKDESELMSDLPVQASKEEATARIE